MKEMKLIPGVWAEKISQRSLRGTPDILACVAGKFVAIELKKSEGEEPDVLQGLKLGRIKDCGGLAMVAYPENKHETLALIRELARGNT